MLSKNKTSNFSGVANDVIELIKTNWVRANEIKKFILIVELRFVYNKIAFINLKKIVVALNKSYKF